MLLAVCGVTACASSTTLTATSAAAETSILPGAGTDRVISATPPPTEQLSSPTPTAALPDISGLSDEFDSQDSLANWKDSAAVEGWPNLIDTIDVGQTEEGVLTIIPKTSGWWGDYRGILLYKEITGDFIATARVKAAGKRDVAGKSGDVPTRTFSLVGLMARQNPGTTQNNWKTGKENWLFITTGYGSSNHPEPQIETKTTKDSTSQLMLEPSKTGWLELRLARISPYFILLYRFEGEEWEISRVFRRPDLAENLQVGIGTYSDWQTIIGDPRYRDSALTFNHTVVEGEPDLISQIDYIHFTRPEVPPELVAKIEDSSPSYSEWLSFLTGD